MAKKKTKQLESEIETIFIRNHRVPLVSSRVRLKSIMDRSLHEVALRDGFILAGRLMGVMLTLLMLFVKLLLDFAHDSTSQTGNKAESKETP